MKRQRSRLRLLLVLQGFLLLMVAGLVVAQRPQPAAAVTAFRPADVVVYRVGDGSSTLVNTGNAVFLDEYYPAGNGQPVQTIALPTAVSGTNKPLIASGTATAEGELTRSADGRYLLLTGYGATPGGGISLPSSAAASIPRVVGRVDALGNVDSSTALTDFADANNPRSAISTDGNDLWVAGAGSGTSGGVHYTTLGSTTSTQLSTNLTNIRQVNIFGGQLYVSSGSTNFKGVNTVGSGLPTTAGQTITPLPGASNVATTTSTYSYYFADLSPNVAGVDTLYVADDASGLSKFSLVSGVWTFNGTIGSATDLYRGLAGQDNGSSVVLYATRGGNQLVTLTDTSGYNAAITGTPSIIATASANEAFRGVALAPQNPAPPLQANNDNYQTEAGISLTVPISQGILSNDTGSPLTIVGHSNPLSGTLNLNSDGSFTYRPNPGFIGSDTFTYTVSNAVQLYRTNLPPLGVFSGTAVTAGGYGSSLYPVPGSSDEFYGLTDRGPNVDGPNGTKVEPIPNFDPAIGKFKFINGQAVLEQAIPLLAADGTPYSGRVNSQNSTGETITDLNGNVLPADPNGYDSEGLVALPDGTFWVSDEYGPFITHFDATGKQIGRISPFDGTLPRELALRVPNRGLEGLTITPDGSTLVASMQSALQQTDLGSTDPKKVAILRITTYKLSDGTLHEYLYLVDNPGSNKTSVSEITALTNTTFLVDERDGNYLPAAYKKLWKIDLTNATDIGPSSTVPGATYDTTKGLLVNSSGVTKTLEALVSTQNTATAQATLASVGITTTTKNLYLDVGATLLGLNPSGAFFSHDKLEGVAVLAGGTKIAISNDSDFGIDGVVGSTPPFQLHAKTSPVTGQQDEGEYLVIDLTALPAATSSAVVTINVTDTIAPETILDTTPLNPSSVPTATFTFHGTDSGSGVARYECLLDGGIFATCSSPVTYTNLSNGPHTFQVRAIDNVGNVDPTPAIYTWTVAVCDPLSVTSNSDNGAGACGTLSGALNQAATASNPVTITFATSVITVTGALPVITPTVPVTIGTDCASNPLTRTLLVAGTGASSTALTLTTNITLRGVAITGFSSYGLAITGNNNVVACSRIGTADGATAAGNGGGIYLAGSNNQLGVAGQPASGNQIAGNTGVGIYVAAGSKSNQASYNLIGYAANGTTPLRNTKQAIQIIAGGQLKLLRGNRIHS